MEQKSVILDGRRKYPDSEVCSRWHRKKCAMYELRTEKLCLVLLLKFRFKFFLEQTKLCSILQWLNPFLFQSPTSILRHSRKHIMRKMGEFCCFYFSFAFYICANLRMDVFQNACPEKDSLSFCVGAVLVSVVVLFLRVMLFISNGPHPVSKS